MMAVGSVPGKQAGGHPWPSARVLLDPKDMTHDDAYTSHNHGFELPNAPQVVVQQAVRPWRVVAGVALCLGLAGIVTGLIVARRQSLSDEHLMSDALQREELRDGWRTLAAAAAQDTQAIAAPAPAASATPTSAAASAATPPPNVVIVNVPTPSGNAAPPNAAPTNVAPSNVTNVTVPSGSPNQSLPPINLSPAPGYLPMQPSYSPAPASSSASTSDLPQYEYGSSNTSGVPPLTPPVGNGSIPGSTSNPALPNNGLVGVSPVPGLPNPPVTGSPTPTGF